MAQYRTHCVLNFALFLPVYWALFYIIPKLGYFEQGALFSSFIFATFFLSPDLDLAHKIPLFSWRGLFSIPFRLYSRFFRHRGLSHIIAVGTISRILWLGLLFLILFAAFFRTYPKPSLLYEFFIQNKPLLLSIFTGICLADFSHILVDIISSKMK